MCLIKNCIIIVGRIGYSPKIEQPHLYRYVLAVRDGAIIWY